MIYNHFKMSFICLVMAIITSCSICDVYAQNQSEPFQYTGNTYQLNIGPNVSVSVFSGGKSIEILRDLEIHAFHQGWTMAFCRDRLISCKANKLADGPTVVTTDWLVGGTYGSKSTITLTFKCYPTFFILDGNMHFSGDSTGLHEHRLAFQYGKEVDSPFQSGNTGLMVIPVTPTSWHIDHKTWYQMVIPWPGGNEQDIHFALSFVPWTGKQPLIPPGVQNGKPDEGLLAVAIPASSTSNLYFYSQQPQLNVSCQNYALRSDTAKWKLTATDTTGKVFNTSGEFKVSPGSRLSKNIKLPASWRGFIRVSLKAKSSKQTYNLQTRLGIIPPPYRKYRSTSPFGIQTWWCQLDNNHLLDLMNWMGAHYVRASLPSPESKPEGLDSKALEKTLDRLENRGLEAVPINEVNPDYSTKRIHIREMDNEVNISTLPSQYAYAQKLRYIRIKQKNPDCLVGTTGMAGVDSHWVEALAENGCWDYIDLLMVHPYSFPNAPEVDMSMSTYHWLVPRLKELSDVMKKYGNKPVFDTEHAYLTLDPEMRPENYPLCMITNENKAAAYMVRTFLQELRYGVIGIEWFLLNDYGGFEMVYKNTPRPNYCAYSVMTKVLDGAKYCGDLQDEVKAVKLSGERYSDYGQATAMQEKIQGHGVYVTDAPKSGIKPGVHRMVFKKQDGTPVVIVWATLKRQDVISKKINTPAWKDQKPGQVLEWNGKPSNNQSPKYLPCTIYTGAKQVKVIDMMGYERTIKCRNGQLDLKAVENPVYIIGANSSILKEASKHCATIFTSKSHLTNWKPVVQSLVPPEGKFRSRSNMYDYNLIDAEMVCGQTYPLTVDITNLSNKTVQGNVKLNLPKGWKCDPIEQVFKIVAGKSIATEPFMVTASETPAKLVKITAKAQTDDYPLADTMLRITTVKAK